MEREFLDENGDKVKMLIEEGNSYEPNLSSGHYKVSDTMRSRAKHRHNNILTSDIGFKSSGFAGGGGPYFRCGNQRRFPAGFLCRNGLFSESQRPGDKRL